MRERMLELEKGTINIGRNPGKAIQRISEPILDHMRNTVEEEIQPNLEQNMLKKADLESRLADTHSKILDESIKHIHLKQTLVE